MKASGIYRHKQHGMGECKEERRGFIDVLHQVSKEESEKERVKSEFGSLS